MRNAIYGALAAYYTISGKKVHKEQEKNTCKAVTMSESLFAKDTARITQNGGSPERTSVLERKKETADVELSRQALFVARYSRVAMLLRKPRKRNGAGFF